ncbi:hypothetical protein M3N64_11695 [Sporolactobacillus sp. CPB3-1]|uniref:DUF3923 domain-containing protein n=1 Tax=Sporolactobacillus mangiferae TaxID=2940498 RepID=A0ABT0MCI6_9BACL|nr:hypothetical protein [Sporolactobacillus mangiferae]MCL1632581.1 hypothetical protein [Sporolactobacillus mangiferae]
MKYKKFFFWLIVAILLSLIDMDVSVGYSLNHKIWYRFLEFFVLFPIWIYVMLIFKPETANRKIKMKKERVSK